MNLLDFCLKTYWKLQKVILPTVRYPQYDYEDVLKSYVESGITWLDVGCGHQILPEWRRDEEFKLVQRCKHVLGIDYDLKSLHKHETIKLLIRGNVSDLPSLSKTFDLVTANTVVEHLKDPIVQFHEIYRVLKPGGFFILHTPNVWGYKTVMARLVPKGLKPKLVYLFEGRKEEDVFPTFYRVNSPTKIRQIANHTGFKLIDLKTFQGDATPLLILLLPILFVEMLWIKLLLTKPFRSFRQSIIAVLQKPEY